MQIANILQPNFAKRALKPRTPRAKQVFTLHNGLHCAQNMLLPVSRIQETFTFDHREKMASQIFLVKTARKEINALRGI